MNKHMNMRKNNRHESKKNSDRKLSEIILRNLRVDSRKRIVSISRKNNIPILKVFEEYHKLKASVIIRHCSLINYDYTVFNHRFFIIIEFKHYISSMHDLSTSENMLIDFLKMHINTNTVSLTEHGLFIDVLFKNLASYNKFIQRIKEFDILGIETYPVLDAVSVENFFS